LEAEEKRTTKGTSQESQCRKIAWICKRLKTEKGQSLGVGKEEGVAVNASVVLPVESSPKLKSNAHVTSVSELVGLSRLTRKVCRARSRKSLVTHCMGKGHQMRDSWKSNQFCSAPKYGDVATREMAKG